MGLRTSGAQPSAAQHAPEGVTGADLADFDSAFGAMFTEEPSTPATVQTKPAANRFDPDEDEDEEEGTVVTPPVEAKPAERDPLEGLEEKQREARDKWKLQKTIKDLKDEVERLKKPTGEPEQKNPFKGLKPDDIVSQALAAMEDDGMSAQEAKKAVSNMTPEEIIAKAKEELKKDMDQAAEQQKAEQAINSFKDKIKEFSKEKAEQYPLIDGLGVQEMVYGIIEKDFLANQEEFGVEYAQKNIMGIEQAAKKANEKLASDLRNALKSPHMRKFVLSLAKEGEGQNNGSNNQSQDFSQLEDEGVTTLTNSVHRRVTDPKDIRDLTNEEALAQSFAYLDN